MSHRTANPSATSVLWEDDCVAARDGRLGNERSRADGLDPELACGSEMPDLELVTEAREWLAQ